MRSLSSNHGRVNMNSLSFGGWGSTFEKKKNFYFPAARCRPFSGDTLGGHRSLKSGIRVKGEDHYKTRKILPRGCFSVKLIKILGLCPAMEICKSDTARNLT